MSTTKGTIEKVEKEKRNWNPSISLVICTYNGAKYIREQMDSLINQTYPLKEILIFDDASKDDTVKILEEYSQSNPIIKIFVNPVNLGFNNNFRQALLKADADVIAISDQDDIWHLQKLEKMINQWVEDTLVIYCDSVRFADTPNRDSEINPHYQRFLGTDSRQLSIFNTISGHAMLLKREIIPLIIDFKDDVIYDWWIGVVAACNGGVSYVPDILVYQRIHGNNVTIGNGYDYQNKKEKAMFKSMVNRHLKNFVHTPNMSELHCRFYKKLAKLWYDSLTKKINIKLALFLFGNRNLVFPYGRKKNSVISHLKHSLMLAKN